MPSENKFTKIAKSVVEKNPHLFDSLMELEKTGKMRTKKRLNFTIDKNIAARFQEYCKHHRYSMSAKIEKAMEEIMEKK